MVTEVDHDQIKAKIVAVLKLNTTDIFTTTGEADKFHYIEVGHPSGLADQHFKTPYLFITNSQSNFESIVNIGSIVTGEHTALQHTFHYDITFVVDAGDSRRAEKKLDDFQKVILETLEEDLQLDGATSSEIDISYPIRIQHLDQTKVGEKKQGRVITLRCVKVIE